MIDYSRYGYKNLPCFHYENLSNPRYTGYIPFIYLDYSSQVLKSWAGSSLFQMENTRNCYYSLSGVTIYFICDRDNLSDELKTKFESNGIYLEILDKKASSYFKGV
jgi:hypothetical protein